jgi:hypothetical protein
MSQQILTISMITREAMRVLENNLTFTKGVNRNYDDQFGREGAKIGSTLNIRQPARYVGRTGPAINIEAQTEQYVQLTLGTQFGVDVQFTSADLELSMDDFSDRFLVPAIAAVSNKIDYDGLAQAINVYNAVGTPGTTPSTLLTFLTASKYMKFLGAPQDNLRAIVLDPNAEAAIVNNLTTLYNPTEEISDQYISGTMGRAIGFKWSADQNVNTIVLGSQGGTPVTKSGVSQTGSSLITTGWSNSITGVLNAGDIFTIAGVHSVNPQTRKSTGLLQQFVVTATANSNGSGTATLTISPSIVTSGQFQTVDVAAASASTITVLGSASTTEVMSLAYHRDAFILGSADLPLPKGVDMAARVSSKKTGLSIRMVRAYDIVNDMFPTRLDVLYGWLTAYPQLACRICG